MFLLLLPLLWSGSSFAMETPVGTLGNSLKVFDALLDAGAEMKTDSIGDETVELIRATNLTCTFKSAPEFDALCTFFTKGENQRAVRGVASSENSWMIGFTLLAAGARKVQVSEASSEIRVRSLVCHAKNKKTESSCTFMQE